MTPTEAIIRAANLIANQGGSPECIMMRPDDYRKMRASLDPAWRRSREFHRTAGIIARDKQRTTSAQVKK